MPDDLARQHNDGLAPQRVRRGHTIYSGGDHEATDQLLAEEIARRHAALLAIFEAHVRRAWDWWRGRGESR